MVTCLLDVRPLSAADDSPDQLSLQILALVERLKPKHNSDHSDDFYHHGLHDIPQRVLSEFITLRSRSIIGVLYHHTAHLARPKSGFSITLEFPLFLR